MKSKVILLAITVLLLTGTSVRAEDDNTCEGACPEGEKKTSYADGEKITCACYPDAEMEQTVPDASKDPNAEENLNQYD